MKGVCESRRPKPKYDKIWDVSVVLKHLSSLYPNEKLSLKDLTHKALMLILLVSSQRGQSIHYLDLQHLTMEEDNYFFDVAEHIKTSTPRSPYTRIDIAAYEPDSTICPLSCLKAYINKTKDLRNNETNCLLVMLGPISMYLGTRFLGGLSKLLDFAVLLLRCSRHKTLGQHLFPKQMKKTSLSLRSWQRQAGSLQKPFVKITTNQFFKETD